MLWIGLTGAMGSGKSTVASLLKSRGYPVLDADQVVHELLRPGQPAAAKIFSTFGGELRAPEGGVDRPKLGRLVFNNPEKLKILEGLLHPLVRAEVARLRSGLEKSGAAAAFYDVPLLFEKKMESQFDFILVVDTEESLRRERLKRRSRLSDGDIDNRFRNQMDPALKAARASWVIKNNGDAKALEAAVDEALKKLKVPLPTAAQA